MFTPDITIDAETYSLVAARPTSSLRSDAAAGMDKPVHLTIAHETARNGKVSSVVYFDLSETIPCNDACSIAPSTDVIRVQFKVQYNPTAGRTDTQADLSIAIEQLLVFLASTTNVSKFLNQEH